MEPGAALLKSGTEALRIALDRVENGRRDDVAMQVDVTHGVELPRFRGQSNASVSSAICGLYRNVYRIGVSPVSETLDTGHGRLESRCRTVLAALAFLEELGRWKDVRALVKIEARREWGAQVQIETRYAITSLALNAREILLAARLHWGIENGFHRSLDVALREDVSAIRLRYAAANFALMRRFALNLFRLDKARKKSLLKKRKAAAWNSSYVVDLLTQ